MVPTTNDTFTVSLPSDREVVMTRVFDAPRELVFKAYTDPELIPHWWGPRILTTTIEKQDLHPGGTWRFVQTDPEGNVYGFHGEYQEVDPPARLVSTFEFEGMPGHVLVETITFEEENGKTKLTSHALFANAEDRNGMIESGMESGAHEGMDRLAELLETMA
jgi:uncharacterized protein YndB with AHSA1/START domain